MADFEAALMKRMGKVSNSTKAFQRREAKKIAERERVEINNTGSLLEIFLLMNYFCVSWLLINLNQKALRRAAQLLLPAHSRRIHHMPALLTSFLTPPFYLPTCPDELHLFDRCGD